MMSIVGRQVVPEPHILARDFIVVIALVLFTEKRLSMPCELQNIIPPYPLADLEPSRLRQTTDTASNLVV